MYIYPDNLKSKAVLWLWELRDIAIVGVGALISVFAMAQLGFLPPVVITAAYAFLSIRRIPVFWISCAAQSGISSWASRPMPGDCAAQQRTGVMKNEQKKRGKSQADHPAAHRDR